MATPTLVRSYIATGTGSTTTISVNTTGGTLLLIKSGVGYVEGDRTVTGVTFNGSSAGMVQHAAEVPAGGSSRAWVYYLNTPTQTTANVVVSWNGSFGNHATIVEVWDNTHATTPVKAISTNNTGGSTASTISTTVTSGAAEDIINDFVVARNNGTSLSTVTHGAGQTTIRVGNTGTTTLHCTVGSSYKAGGTSVTMTENPDSASPLTIVAFPIAASAGGGGSNAGAARHYYTMMQGA